MDFRDLSKTDILYNKLISNSSDSILKTSVKLINTTKYCEKEI